MDLPDRFEVELTDADYRKALHELRQGRLARGEYCLVSQAVRRTLGVRPQHIMTQKARVSIFWPVRARYTDGRALSAAVAWFDRNVNTYDWSSVPTELPKRLRGKKLTFVREG